MDRSDAENEKTSINDFREAVESIRSAAERINEISKEIALHLEALSNTAKNSMVLKLFGLSPEQIREFVEKMTSSYGETGEERLLEELEALDEFLDKTEDYEDIIDKQIDEDS